MWGLVFSLGRVRVRYLGLMDVLVICQVLVVMGMIISKRWMDEGAKEENEGVIRDFREDPELICRVEIFSTSKG